jgi:hypothetical protein
VETSPVRRRDLLAAGADRVRLDGALRAGRLAPVFRGIYAADAADGLSARWAAALLTQPEGTVLSHRSAAVALALNWVPESWSAPDAEIDLTVPVTDTRRERAGIRIRRAVVPFEHRTSAGGLPVTAVARTLVDLVRARDVGRLLGLQLLDGALRFGSCSAADLDGAVAAAGRRHGVKRARALAELARERVDSAQETRLRLVLIDSGVDPSDVDVDIRLHGEDGALLARGDLGSRRHLMWWEYDGRDVHSDEDSFSRDRVRDRWLESRGWHVMRFSAADFERPERIVTDWRRGVALAPARIAAMSPGRSPEVAAARQILALNT